MSRQDYDQMAHAYRRHRTVHPDVIDVLVTRADTSRNRRVLEIGCGTANYLLEVAAQTGAACTGIDASQAMLAGAVSNAELLANRRSCSPQISFVHGSAEDLPLPDGAFDLAFSVDVIHHIEARDDASREMFRVLRPGGTAMVVTESEDDLRQRTPHVTYFPDILSVELGRYPSLATIMGELAASGFELDEPVSISRRIEVDSITAFRDKAYSSLHLIQDDAFSSGLARMDEDLRHGPIPGERRYTIVIARRPEMR